MILSFNNIEKVAVKNLRGGDGTVYLQKVNPTLCNMKMYAKITIPTGASIGSHVHEVDEETYVVISGKGILIIDGKETEVNVGDISLCKKGRNHGIKNIDQEDLVLIAVVNE